MIRLVDKKASVIMIILIIALLVLLYMSLATDYAFEKDYVKNLTKLIMVIINKGEYNLLKDLVANENVKNNIIEESKRINENINNERGFKIKEIINKNNKYYVEVRVTSDIDGFLTYHLEFIKKEEKLLLYKFLIDK